MATTSASRRRPSIPSGAAGDSAAPLRDCKLRRARQRLRVARQGASSSSPSMPTRSRRSWCAGWRPRRSGTRFTLQDRSRPAQADRRSRRSASRAGSRQTDAHSADRADFLRRARSARSGRSASATCWRPCRRWWRTRQRHASAFARTLAGVDAASDQQSRQALATPAGDAQDRAAGAPEGGRARQRWDPLRRLRRPSAGAAGRPRARAQRVFQSPGPIYEPEGLAGDYWRLARALCSRRLSRRRPGAQQLQLPPHARPAR